MSKESIQDVMAAEAAAQRKQDAEDEAQRRFEAVRARLDAAGSDADATATGEFRAWMESRRETDHAWGQWAMAMDRKAAS